jgi:signal transduction histidine kinase
MTLGGVSFELAMPWFKHLLPQTSFIPTQQFPLVYRYLLALAAVITALGINWLVAPHLSLLPPFLTFVAAVMLTAWYGGFPSAIFATVLSGLAINYYFIPPVYNWRLKPADIGTILFFAIEALVMAYCIDYLRRNEERLRRVTVDLEQQVVTTHDELSEKEERLRLLMYELAATEERERRQLAAELHDYLAQLLILARMRIKQAQQTLYRSAEESHRFIRQTDDLLRRSVDYVRTLMAELYPVHLQQLGVAAALRWLAEQMSRHGLTVDVSIGTESFSISDEITKLLYQSVRELLMNIVKHAAVVHAQLTLNVDADSLLVSVQDKGRGFDPSRLVPTSGGQRFGLQNVRDRITTCGGRLLINSAVGQGTSITIVVPLRTSLQSVVFKAASSGDRDRIGVKPEEPPNQQSLPF